MTVLACVLPAGCTGSDDGGSSAGAEPSGPGTQDDSSDDFRPPDGKVVFDLRAGSKGVELRHPAVRAYVAWQRAATEAIRDRKLSDAVRDGAADSPESTVERSIATVSDSDYTVARTMIGRLEGARSTPRAAILHVCLWSPTFDYRDRASGRPVTGGKPRWLGAEVRMTRESAHHGAWKVAGLSAEQDCEGSRP